MHNTRKTFVKNQICPRCLTVLTDEFTVSTPDGLIHEACEKLPRPSKSKRKTWTGSAKAANALARNRRRLS